MKNINDYKMRTGISSQPEVQGVYANVSELKVLENPPKPQRRLKEPDVKEISPGKNTLVKIILIPMLFLLLVFLITVILTSLLFIQYSRMTEELSHMKQNESEMIKTELNELKNTESEMIRSEVSELKNTVAELTEKLEQLTKKQTCDSGWQEFEGICYYFSTTGVNWGTAEMTCLSKGSNLAIITNEREQMFLNNHRNDRFYWIGLTDEDKENVFKWVDGTVMSYSYWRKGEPNNGGGKENCVHLWQSGEWNDAYCSNNNYAICERKL